MDAADGLKCSTLIVKVAGRCNINCSYCYMYNMGDSSYLKQPKKMSDETVVALMQQVKTHCLNHEISRFMFVLHGGEPLLAGKAFFRFFVSHAEEILKPHNILPSFSIQTNATLLDEDWCKTLGELNINAGISIDGTKESHDMYRLDFKGNGTYDDVLKGLRTAQQSPYLKTKPGLLCVLNIHSDPIEIYNSFRQLGAPNVDIIIPDYNHDTPPPEINGSNHSYADWLIRLFDHWYGEGDARLSLRFFEGIIDLILGNENEFDFMGTSRNELLVIETDGGIEAVDVLKICGDGFTKTKANVSTHGFEDAMQTPLGSLYREANAKVAKKCSVCPVMEVCGGGYIPHRYSSSNGFNNPSVYCNNLLKLITHIQNRVMDSLPPEFIEAGGAEKLSYEEALEIIAYEMANTAEPEYAGELEGFKK
jgi:uncharacterized protein